MKFTTGLAIGVGLGYVLGATATDERRAQAYRFVENVAGTDQAQMIIDKGRTVVEFATNRAKHVIGDGMTFAADRIRPVS